MLHTGLLLLMHPLPGLSKCSWYKPSDIQHYQQRVMKGMLWQSAAVTRQKPPRCLQQGRKYHIKIKARQGKIAHTLGWKEIQTTPKPLVPLSSSQCSTEKICLEWKAFCEALSWPLAHRTDNPEVAKTTCQVPHSANKGTQHHAWNSKLSAPRGKCHFHIQFATPEWERSSNCFEFMCQVNHRNR